MVGDFLQDIRYALRQFRRNPGYAALAALTLSMGIGANSAIYSILDAVLLSPLPFENAERVVVLLEDNRTKNNPFNPVSPANYSDWRTRNGVFQSLSAFHYASTTLTGFDYPERVPAVVTTEEFFRTVGATPRIGRIPSVEEIREGAPTVVLSDGFWRRRFGGERGILGKTLTLNGEPFVVAAVLAPRANFPPAADVWFPRFLDQQERTARGRYLTVVGRLKDGFSIERARADLAGIAQVLESEHPRFNSGFGVSLRPLRAALAGQTRGTALLLFATVVFLLMIACANVANLQIGRLTERRQELAVRLALGGSRRRLVRQLLTESVLLGCVGGLGGLGWAAWGTPYLSQFLPPSFRIVFNIGLNLKVVAFALIVSVLSALILGTIAGLQSWGVDWRRALKEGARTGSTSNRQRIRGALVVGEVALTLMLLVGSGLLARSLLKLTAVDPGFDARNLVTVRVSLPDGIGGQESPKAPFQSAFFEKLLERVAAIPGVDSIGAVNFLPIESGAAGTMLLLRDRPLPVAGKEPVADIVVVAGDYFQTMRIPLLAGRFFDRRDTAYTPRAVIVNEAAVREFWPGEDPIGKRVTMIWDRGVDGEVVGVVGDVLQKSLAGPTRATLYWPESQFTYGFMTLVVRSNRDPSGLVPEIRDAVGSLDTNLPLDIHPMQAILADSVAAPRITVQIVSLFTLAAILLAMVGIYGVISQWVRQRRHEIGIRMALGADRGRIVRLVLAKGAALALLGVAIGAGASLVVTRWLQSSLFGVSSTDPATFAGAGLLLTGVALLACCIPARRATRMDPLEALRCE